MYFCATAIPVTVIEGASDVTENFGDSGLRFSYKPQVFQMLIFIKSGHTVVFSLYLCTDPLGYPCWLDLFEVRYAYFYWLCRAVVSCNTFIPYHFPHFVLPDAVNVVTDAPIKLHVLVRCGL